MLVNASKDQLIIENNDRKTALSIACECGNICLVKTLLQYDTNIQNSMPIHMAIKSGDVDIIQLLLENKIQLTLTNTYGETPLHIACKHNRNDILKVILNHQNRNLDLEIRDKQGYTPLLTASYFDHRDCIKTLLIHNANITAVDNYGKNICKYDFNYILYSI